MQKGEKIGKRLEDSMRKRIAVLRRKSEMTGDHVQDMVAAITGIRRGTINGYCTGRLGLGSKNGPRVAAALDLTWADLQREVEGADERSDRDETGVLLERLEAMSPDDPFLRGVGEALRLLARRLDVAEKQAALPNRRAARGS